MQQQVSLFWSFRRIWHVWRMGLVGALLWGLLVACGGPSTWELSPAAGGQCNVITQLQKNEAYQTASTYDDPNVSYQAKDPLRSPYRALFAQGKSERGCFVLWWYEDQAKKKIRRQVQAVMLDASGEIRARNPVGGRFDAVINWEVDPAAIEGKTVETRLYLLRRQDVERSEAQHLKDCETIATPAYNCFPGPSEQPAPNACWFFVKIEPKTNAESNFSLSKVDGGCRICAREICGNSKDDDCDGTPDEGCRENDCHHPGARRPCYGGPKGTARQGICRAGFQVCREVKKGEWQWTTCQEEQRPGKELCNGLDDDCDGKTDEGLKGCCTVGLLRTCESGKGICKEGAERCVYQVDTEGGAWETCRRLREPEQELCNGADDDCDGQIDEAADLKLKSSCSTGSSGLCATGKEQCTGGVVRCVAPQPQTEICDNKDNDCDGLTDETFAKLGLPCVVPKIKGPCANGIYTACQQGQLRCTQTRKAESAERCGDEIDNDCNGLIDESSAGCRCVPGKTRTCYEGPTGTNGVGVCTAGKQTCHAGGSWGECTNQIKPSSETCNGKDDDCDGQADEDFPDKGGRCFVIGKRGPCAYGRYTRCTSSGAVCTPDVQPKSKEDCTNGIDDDCNGLIDDGACTCKPGQTRNCYKGPPGSVNKGICKAGTQTCTTGGFWGGCGGEVLPQPEVCDGKDNDCDGQTDEDIPALGLNCRLSNLQGVCQTGRRRCLKGALVCESVVVASRDVCDARDNDCDGQIDEDDPFVGRSCSLLAKKGECRKGTLWCRGGSFECRSSLQPVQEKCNGLDEDCDGQIDNNLTAPPCEKTAGVCQGATKRCAGQAGWLVCRGGDYTTQNAKYEERESLCDNLDNDCDGKIDVDAQGKALSRRCYTGPAGSLGPGRPCREGTQECKQGKWEVCQGETKPSLERCGDGKDNDCDGQIDEDPPCGCWGSAQDHATAKPPELVVKGKVFLDQEKGPGRTEPYQSYHRLKQIDGARLTLDQSKGLGVGDELLVIHLQGKKDSVGRYELALVQKREGDQSIVLQTALRYTYGADAKGELGEEKVLVVRIPRFRRVVVEPGGLLSVSPWNGERGGVLVFRASELVHVKGRGQLAASGQGYRGAAAPKNTQTTPQAGESLTAWSSSSTGTNGGGSSPTAQRDALGGGGGGYGGKGGIGTDGDGKEAAKGGETYGNDLLTGRIFFGSGGGAGLLSGDPNAGNLGGLGGAGGGLVMVFARTIHVAGTIAANGQDGANGVSGGAKVGGGGGGAGGSILLTAEQLILRKSARIVAKGGEGGLSAADGPEVQVRPWKKAKGGKGGIGRIQIQTKSINRKAIGDVTSFTPWFPVTPAANAPPANCR